MSVLADLRALRDLLSDPKRWTKGCAAKDQLGQPCNSRDDKAVAWDLWGGGRRIAHGPSWLDLDKALGKENRTYYRFNDHLDTKHKHVMEYIERAIEAEKGRVV